MNRQRGQSMTEFAIGATALSLLMLGTITLAGYQQVQRRSLSIARQTAFESAWLNGRAASAPVNSRMFRAHLDDAGLAAATGHARYVTSDSIQVTSTQTAAPGRAVAAVSAMLVPLRTAGGFLGGGFDLRNSGYATGTIAVHIAPLNSLPQPFRDLDLQLDQPFALLTDGWNAAGPDHVHARAGGLVPTQRLTGLSALWRGLAAPLLLLEPRLNTLCLGLLEPETVPQDRLERSVRPVQRNVVCG